MSVNSVTSSGPQLPSQNLGAAPGFDKALSDIERPVSALGAADYVSGQIGINIKKGRPATIVFFDTAGQKLTQIPFDAKSILKTAERLGIALNDLIGLADQLDQAQVPYKPYSLFQGTGSDHGIDLRDLANGGLGTAYDWRIDVNVASKGKYAAQRLADAQALAQRLNLTANPEVTTGGGLALANLTPQTDSEGILRSYVVTNGGWAMWYRTEAEARAAVSASKAFLLNLQTDTRG